MRVRPQDDTATAILKQNFKIRRHRIVMKNDYYLHVN